MSAHSFHNKVLFKHMLHVREAKFHIVTRKIDTLNRRNLSCWRKNSEVRHIERKDSEQDT
jgi:hypothetical protein